MKPPALLLFFLLGTLPTLAAAAVRVATGPTPIQGGEAKSAGDITVINEKLAFALAVGSPVPYGVPRGAIIDVAPVTEGSIGRDCVVFADFIPDNWSAWPNTYQHIDVLESGPQRAVVRTVRDWGKATITTIYTLESNADSVQIQTTMHNDGNAALPGPAVGSDPVAEGRLFLRASRNAGCRAGQDRRRAQRSSGRLR